MKAETLLTLSLTLASTLAALPAAAAPHKVTRPFEEASSGAAFVRLDTHAHLNGMYWEFGPGGPVVTDFAAAAATALDSMNVLGVQMSFLLPPPFSPEKFASPMGYDYTELAPVAQANPDRFAFLGGGGLLNTMIHDIPADSVTAAILQDFTDKAVQIAEAGAAGFGETTALHLSFFTGHPFLEAPPDHPLFLRLAEIAAGYGMPVDLHMDAVLQDQELRSVFGPPNPQPPDVVHANIDALGRLLAHDPGARIVWQHVGWDNTGDMTVALLDSLLTEYPNLYLSLRILPVVGLQIEENRPVDLGGVIRPEWLQLITDHPTRFLLGSDQFYGIPGLTPARTGSVESTWNFADQLPESLAQKVADENVRQVYRMSGGSTSAPGPSRAGDGPGFGPTSPNPSRGGFRVPVSLGATEKIRVDLVDVRGRVLGVLHEGIHPRGDHVIRWDGRLRSGRRPPPGVYLARLVAGGQTRTVKVVLLP